MASAWHSRDSHAGPIAFATAAPAPHQHESPQQQAFFVSGAGAGAGGSAANGVFANNSNSGRPTLQPSSSSSSSSSSFRPAAAGPFTFGNTPLSASASGPAVPGMRMNMNTTGMNGSVRTAGRKRSRDEISELTAAELSRSTEAAPLWPSSTSISTSTSSSSHTSASSNAPSPCASTGDAMTDTPTSIAAAPPHYNTEEVSERLRSSSLLERPGLESRKSMRLLEPSSSSVSDAHPGDHTHTFPSPSSSLPSSSHPSSSSAGRDIDDATLTLGIGWTTVSRSPTMVAAVRGWARHLENNFPLASVRFVWHNKAVPTYLISAVTARHTPGGTGGGSPGYFLFNEDLTYGQLVAKSWEAALDNLRERPMRFAGEPMFLPAANPSSSSPSSSSLANASFNNAAGAGLFDAPPLIDSFRGPAGGAGMDIEMSG